jgi:hypothetical protein
MTPRQALYNLVLALGPRPTTKRVDNVSVEEAQLAESIELLRKLIDDVEALEVVVDNIDQTEIDFDR